MNVIKSHTVYKEHAHNEGLPTFYSLNYVKNILRMMVIKTGKNLAIIKQTVRGTEPEQLRLYMHLILMPTLLLD